MIVNIYLGILFGQLVVPHRPKSIQTLEELVSQSQISWCVTQGSSIYELFKQSDKQSVYGQLGGGMKNVSSADEGVRRVIESGWAFLREKSILTFKVSCILNSNQLLSAPVFGLLSGECSTMIFSGLFQAPSSLGRLLTLASQWSIVVYSAAEWMLIVTTQSV